MTDDWNTHDFVQDGPATPDPTLNARIKSVLVNNGVDIDGGSFHSWRCFDKGRYPEPCTCTDEVVVEIMEVVSAEIVAARDRGYGEAMDDGWGEPGHIKEAVDKVLEQHHTNRCCGVCDYHVMPHRGCILR
jgi:hypothetical protein